jgi:hypothetical protein
VPRDRFVICVDVKGAQVFAQSLVIEARKCDCVPAALDHYCAAGREAKHIGQDGGPLFGRQDLAMFDAPLRYAQTICPNERGAATRLQPAHWPPPIGGAILILSTPHSLRMAVASAISDATT